MTAAGCLSLPPSSAPTGAEDLARDGSDARAVVAARDIESLYAKGEVRGFRFEQNGILVGTSHGRYEGPRTGKEGGLEHHFRIRNTLQVPDRAELRTEGLLVLDGAGRLLRGWEQSAAARLEFRVEGAELVLRAGEEEERLAYGNDDGFMGFMSTLHEELLFALYPIVAPSWERRVLNLSGGAPTPWEATFVSQVGDDITVQTSLGERVVLSNGRISRIEVPDDGLTVTAMASAEFPTWSVEVARPLEYTPAADARFERREVELVGRANEPRLLGELLLPAGYRDGRPRPAVVFLSASGLVDRYGFAGPPPVDLGSHQITDALANAGFVVLRYDEPGFGESEAAPLSWERQLEDARRAVRTVMVQPEIDPGQIVIVGHGEGAWRGLVLARERPGEVAAVALLGPPGRSFRDTFERSAAAVRARVPEADRAQALAQHTELMAAIESGEGLPAGLQPQGQWLQEVFDVDPRSLLERTPDTVALWLAYGDKDLEVDVEDAAQRLGPLISQPGRRGATARFPSLDHLFMRETNARSTPASYRTRRPVDPAFIEALVVWLRGSLGRD